MEAAKDAMDRTLKAGDDAFFFDLKPENLRRTSTKLQPSGTYATEEHYQRALLSTATGNIWEGFGNNFTPPAMRFRARRVKLDFMDTETKAKVQFSYSASQPLWQPPRPGDYFRYNADNQSPALYRIVSIGGHEAEVVKIQNGITNEERKEKSNESEDALLIRSVRPIEHYLSMLGIYIHQLFFTSQSPSGDQGALPDIVWTIEQTRCAGLLPAGILGRDGLVRDDLSEPDLDTDVVKIQERIAKLYLWLICRDFTKDGDWSNVRPRKSGYDAFADLKQYIGHIRMALESLLKLGANSLDNDPEELLFEASNAKPSHIELELDLHSILLRILGGNDYLKRFKKALKHDLEEIAARAHRIRPVG